MSDAPSGPVGRYTTIPRERRTTRGRESLPEPSLAESLAADGVQAVREAVPSTARLWSDSTWGRVYEALEAGFRCRLRCQTRPPA